jgi:glycosyltransferase involved in cell wall biosynthesis
LALVRSGCVAPLVLLFYDGYELKARPGGLGTVYSRAHHTVRDLYKRARGQHPNSGLFTVFQMLVAALRHVGADVRVNDFAAARANPTQPIGVAGYEGALSAVAALPNPRLIGPGVTLSPWEPRDLYDDARNRGIIVHSAWLADIMRPWHEGKIALWHAGFDLGRYADSRGQPKTHDVLIYDKIYHRREDYLPRTINALIALLDSRGLSYTMMRYGHYALDDYKRMLAASRAMAFFSHAETQGIAYQEALASNVPVFAWNEGVWLDPLAEKLNRGQVACESVPFWDARCGETFTAETLPTAWEIFWAKRETYQPRAFVSEVLSLESSAEAYLAAYRRVAQR